MKPRTNAWMAALALSMAAGFSTHATAQSPSSTGGAPPSHTSGTGTTMQSTPATVGTQGDKSFSAWLHEHSLRNKGRVSRSDYMTEMSRRWDAADASRQGLTPEEINRIYGGQ